MKHTLKLILPAVSILAFVACGAGPKSPQPPQQQKLTAKEIIANNKPAIVRVESQVGVGTGFVIDPNGKIVTNLHVILGSPDLNVVFSDGTKREVTRILSYRKEFDLAILQVDASDLAVLPLGNSDEISSGDKVVAIGNPLGVFDYTVSDGLISAVRELDGRKILQTTAPISVGSSGGPLFNEYGEVIGVATFFAQGGQNLNFAIPTNYLERMLTDKRTLTTEAFHRQTKGTKTLKQPKRVHPKVARNIPQHDDAILDSCSDAQLKETYLGIQKAIDLGAPVYNRGEYEACYVVYRNAAERLVSNNCNGIEKALQKGLDDSAALEKGANKAWAIRDAFDGVLLVIHEKARKAGTKLPR